MTKKYKSPITGDVITGEDSYGIDWLEVLESNLYNAAIWALETGYHPKCLSKIELSNSLLNCDEYAQQMLISYWSCISDPLDKLENKTECVDKAKINKSVKLNGDILKISPGYYKNLTVNSNIVTFDNVVVLKKFTLQKCLIANGNVKVTNKTKCKIDCGINNLKITYVDEEEL